MFLLLFAVLSLIFGGVFAPGTTLFSSDGPLGRLMSDCHHLPDRFTGCWQDLNMLGFREVAATPSLSFGLQWLLKPVAFSKFYAPLALLILGLSAWYFFRVSGLAPPACILGGLATVLNSSFFSVAAWGVAAHALAIAMTFLALAALNDTSSRRRWLRVALAGLAVGMGVTEGADLGAIFSVLVAAFVIYQSWVAPGPRVGNLVLGVGRVSLVAVCAALLAAQAFSELVINEVRGMFVPQVEVQSAQARWDWATQWSLPKSEALGFVMPGLFGYRMDSPDGASYWGTTGRDAAWDRYDESGGEGPVPTGFVRYTGGGYYAGVMVVLVAVWAGFGALRRKEPLFNPPQRKLLWFWLGVGLVSLLLGFGRYAPFYRLVYALPYFSTIRNPIKFLDVLSFALVILFAFGLDGLWRKYLRPAGGNGETRWAGLKGWWSKAGGSEKRWLRGCLFVLAASLTAWLLYFSSRSSMLQYLQTVQFESSDAHAIAAFSARQVGWFVLFFVLAVGLMALIFSGAFAGRRAVWGAGLLGLLLVVDLGRANLPWVKYWDYQEKYLSNPIVDVLREKPWEHRVTIFGGNSPSYSTPVDQLYKIVWLHDQFPYYNIQSLEAPQMSRMPSDIAAFTHVLLPSAPAVQDTRLVLRFWQLTNVRYLLGGADALDSINHNLDPEKQRFRVVQRFKVVPKPGLAAVADVYDVTVAPAADGEIALAEFTGALPRARLYSTWRTVPNSEAALAQVVSESFDPEQSVIVTGGPPVPPSAQPIITNSEVAPEQIVLGPFDPEQSVPESGGPPGPSPAPATNQIAGKLEFTGYSPKDVVLQSDAPSATVLLLNDRYDPNWKVLVDGAPGTVLRCNYLMRGVALPPGAHKVEFRFQPPTRPLHVSLAALGFGVLLLGVTAMVGKERRNDSPTPVVPVRSLPPESVPIPVTARSAPHLKRKKRR